ncbi:hypothetical protein PENTCL1PPCAC_2200, partial [Pristionchus entomophagus]
GGVDGAIHRAAGYNQLQTECRKHPRPVATGDAVITDSCKLSAYVKKIIHCVGPICYGGVTEAKRNQLESCYRRAIELSEENRLRSIAFCCISTGIYGYDNEDAARTVVKFLWKHLSKEENAQKWDRVVLCLFMDIDKKCYKHYITKLIQDPNFFDEKEEEKENEDEDDKEKKKEDKEDKKDKKDEDMDEDKEKKTEKEEKKEGNEKDETDSSKKDDAESEKPQTKEGENAIEKDTVSQTEDKSEKNTVEGGDGVKTEKATTSASNTSASEKMDEERDGVKGEGEKENNVVDGNVKKEEGMTRMKRGLSDEKEGEPPIKRDKPERESAV